uniref:Sugar phosphate transporter domain-containing protein n=1 Tax=Phaeocystis antarctica TaxID=33657 RepID=A0A7S0HPQ6_9EUKA|mmetsp:Transcript_27368/g.64632  ORF Transcript_27368/g.64632 Transcript_27368/m.64632 type:complete len:343 (+) Transcript_27368:82-1110(+)
MMLGLDTSKKQGIFGTYVMLWVSSHVLVYASKMPGAPQYNATSVVLITEAVKLVMALAFYRRYDGDTAQLVREVRGSTDLLLQYVVPALLYCVYNNLVYVNLTFFDPGTYNVLMQLRIVLTGVLYQLLFSTRLGRNQWLAIILIMLGCVCKESPKLFGAAGRVPSALSHAWVLLAFQMVCSVFAGVYNEKLLKKDGKDGRRVGTNLQNAYMYLNSIWCNLAFLVLNGTLQEAVHPDNLRAVFSPTVLAIVAIMASVGMVTGFFLKILDSVLKSVASAVEVLLTTLLSTLFFGTPLALADVLAAAMVGGGVALYARPAGGRGAVPAATGASELSELIPMGLKK